ncbi:MAG: DEAD/DEAH box helicase [Myxococcota bacterium]
MEFESFFRQVTGHPAGPHPWQLRLGQDPVARDRLIRIPTGQGKTAGVVTTWLYHRVHRADRSWPTRLVFVLPMRVLVEQTHAEVARWLAATPGVAVHLLMGGRCEDEYALDPDRPAVLVGTQDMLLSRALMRGYAAGRARWPVDFGLLHRDALWVLDEVQQMDVGLATSAQLSAFRGDGLRPSRSWWMSATLQSAWFSTVDFAPRVAPLWGERTKVADPERSGGLWDVRKPVSRSLPAEPADLVQLLQARHAPGTVTLVVVNRVDRAVELHKVLRKAKHPADLRLVHSRFRGHERRSWVTDFLRRDTPIPPEGRVIVATQVVEAGVDLSARLLVTDLAPWPSLVQRFGRCARYAAETGDIVVVGAPPADDAAAAPYDAASVRAASDALDGLPDGSPATLEQYEPGLSDETLAALYPYAPTHVLRRPDLQDLFDTTADLAGADLDVSRFVRSGEERDVTVFWRSIGGPPDAELQPHRDELCPVPVAVARKWLDKADAWRWSYPDGAWIRLDALAQSRLVPGTVLLVDAKHGGYDPERGFDRSSARPVGVVPPAPQSPAARAFDAGAEGENSDALSALEAWKTVGFHGREVGEQAAGLAETLQLPADLRRLLVLAGRWHDHGKAHPAFQSAIRADRRQERFGHPRGDLAKAPDDAWIPPVQRHPKGFRHELASGLALIELVRRAAPTHAGLLGPWTDLIAPSAPDLVGHPLAEELAALTADELDLVLWLVLTHHGKVRCALLPSPGDPDGRIRGVADGDEVPAVDLAGPDGAPQPAPQLTLRLDLAALGLSDRYGPSWADRVSRLRQKWGEFDLAFLEAVFRAADVRASRATTLDPWLGAP